ncbi:MAG: amino acid ABC transporter ATP-binding protein [Bdellovibrionales bacterium]|nr:amino acid ABC transporter ATP-binding protein [Bdellovibrionales bacterium]
MVVSIENIRKAFHDKFVVDGISLEVEEGDLVALIGPSGCGKSTLLRCINGLETVDEGAIDVLGTTLKCPTQIGQSCFIKRAQAVRRHTGMVFQNFNLFPHLTILQNLTMAPQVVRKSDRVEAEALAHEHLAKVGLADKADRYPIQLSGGQQQRAAIARALMMTPKLMLYDEPTSALDPTLVNEVLRVMKQLDQEGMTQIVVTHEMRFARDVADRIVFIEHGKIVEMGPPEQIFGSPRDERTRNYLRHFL